jgi:DNA-binding NarL/FixJ family response regulator
MKDVVLPVGTRRLVVVSDAPLLRAGLRALLPQRGVEIVDELDGPERLLERARATAAQLVVAAPADGGGDELFAALHDLPGDCAAIVLLAVPGFRIQADALAARFDLVCLPLNAGRHELHAAIRAALVDETPELSVQILCSGVNGTLSPREQEVLRELAQGKSNRDIAGALWVSEDTVKTHLRRVYRKLGVSTRAEAVALYIGTLGSA